MDRFYDIWVAAAKVFSNPREREFGCHVLMDIGGTEAVEEYTRIFKPDGVDSDDAWFRDPEGNAMSPMANALRVRAFQALITGETMIIEAVKAEIAENYKLSSELGT